MGWELTDQPISTFFYPADLEDHRIIRVGTAESADPFLFLPGNIATESQSGDERKQGVECPVTEPFWGKMLKNKFVTHLKIKRTFPLFQNLYDLHLDLIFLHVIGE